MGIVIRLGDELHRLNVGWGGQGEPAGAISDGRCMVNWKYII
jgi:hypothetical protein